MGKKWKGVDDGNGVQGWRGTDTSLNISFCIALTQKHTNVSQTPTLVKTNQYMWETQNGMQILANEPNCNANK